MIGHWAFVDRKVSPDAALKVGDRHGIRCEPMDEAGKHELIAREQSLDAAQDPEVTRYWALEVRPAGRD